MFRIFGPPGTGKTTTLLNMVDKALEQGVHPHRIAFLAFTKKAATEAKERAAQRFNLDPKKDLMFFRTLHSLALTMSDIRPEQVMQPENYRELGNVIGISLNESKIQAMDDIQDLVSTSDPILGLINLTRLKKSDLRTEYNRSNLEQDWNTIKYVDECLREYKTNLGLYDFTDMLQEFVNQSGKYCPKFDLCFLDEAQDLSALQWDIAHILDDNSDRMYAAGDDDQAIYRWAGADVDQFINLPGGSETLSQSFRVPRQVHTIAEGVVRRITRRFPKRYEPKDEPGNVTRIDTITGLDMSQGTWLILSQAGYQLTPVAADLRSNGYLFNYRGHRSISEKISEAVNGWEQMRKGREITAPVARIIYSYMSVGNRVKRGFKKIPHLMDDETVTLEALQRDHGLFATIDMIWHDAMDKIPDSERAYITALLRRGEKFNGTPRITLSTIHGSKGGEAENVVLFTDVSPAASKAAEQDPDELHRVFYVGVTRTKKNLYLIEPEDALRSYSI